MREEQKNFVELNKMIIGYWVSRSISVVAKLGIADLLVKGSKPATELAKTTQSDSSYLYRVLRALASVGIFEEHEGKKFSLNPISELLRSDHPNTLRSFAIMHGMDWHWKSWGNLSECVKTGKPGIEIEYGKSLFEYLKTDLEALSNFSKTMEELTASNSEAIVKAYDFGKYPVIADVGASQGELLYTILNLVSSAKGILFDLPEVVENAKKNLNDKKQSFSSRVSFESGSFFETFPIAADLCILKYILHDWDDERSIQILKTFAKTAKADAKIVLIELLLSEKPGASRAKLVDLEMMAVTPGGRERTETEFQALFSAAGLKIDQIVPTETSFFIIEGSRL